ncbi:outer membrane protein assembly factor BamA [Spirochaetia bacterium 38H-sp]|uniref:Outer membrane protein assembly factor BamA n=1 Tax=Rarispira pelagica TaxID=3141764 RepID=A0ABU9UAT3_9SPIR
MLKRKSYFLLFFIIIGLFDLFPQENNISPDWYIDKPIVNIVFDGLNYVSENEINGIVKQYIGKNFSNELFWELQEKLYALDYFEEIKPKAEPGDESYSSVILRFIVKEFPVILSIDFEGNISISSYDLRDKIITKPGDLLNEIKLKSDLDAIKNYYVEKGYPTVVVSYSKTEEEKGIRIVFSIEEGPKNVVRKISFSGNSVFAEKTLKGLMKTKERGFLVTGVYDDSVFQADLKKIVDYYTEHGYIDVKIEDVKKDVEETEDAVFYDITISITEGRQYRFGGVEFNGNNIFPTDKLKELIHSKEGDIFNEVRFNADYGRVLDLYYENGYIFNTIEKKEIKDESSLTVKYVINITERPRAHIENIIVKGNTKTDENVILREIPLKPGDVFSKTKIIQGLLNLRNLQYFSNIVPETYPGSTDGLMNLIINVEEGATANIRFGATFGGSSEFPVQAIVDWSDVNFMGKGLDFGVNLVASPDEQTVGFHYTDGWLFGRRLTGGVSFNVSHKDTGNTIPQDTAVDGVIFTGSEDNAVPDNGLYTGQWVDSSTGEVVDNPSQTQIDSGEVITDYAYAIANGFSIPDSLLMSYQTWEVSLGLNTSYRFDTPFGRLTPSSSLNISLSFLDYDADIYRPFDETTRESRGKWSFINKLSFGIGLDSRDIVYAPSNGYYLGQSFVFTGGFLGGSRHYIKSSSTAEGYFTLFDIPVFDNWSFKWVFALHTKLMYNLDQFWVPQGELYQATSLDQMYIDGYFVGKGWTQEPSGGGRTLWDNWAEIRMPIIEQIVWWNFYFEFPAFDIDVKAPWNISIENYRFGIGGGFKFVIPQFPIGFFLTKRFKVVDGAIQWQEGTVSPDSLGLDFVFTIGYQLY